MFAQALQLDLELLAIAFSSLQSLMTSMASSLASKRFESRTFLHGLHVAQVWSSSNRSAWLKEAVQRCTKSCWADRNISTRASNVQLVLLHWPLLPWFKLYEANILSETLSSCKSQAPPTRPNTGIRTRFLSIFPLWIATGEKSSRRCPLRSNHLHHRRHRDLLRLTEEKGGQPTAAAQQPWHQSHPTFCQLKPRVKSGWYLLDAFPPFRLYDVRAFLAVVNDCKQSPNLGVSRSLLAPSFFHFLSILFCIPSSLVIAS